MIAFRKVAQAVVFALCLLAMSTGGATAFAPHSAAAMQPARGSGLVHRVDIFRDCFEIKSCRNGRCRPAFRCQKCGFENVCNADGCAFRERCHWTTRTDAVVPQPTPSTLQRRHERRERRGLFR